MYFFSIRRNGIRRICNFNFRHVCYHHSRLKDRKLLILPTPPLFVALAQGNPFKFCDEIWHQKTIIVGLPDAEEIMTLAVLV